ncbi:hypothetical protein QAD02_017666 [Eretmocerus hayati]|uniref:Uncharacterized protein n=1 Tax=Eretmocerus hayati TaxID=131215 RepID=A0ACC2PH19_9HYME|nr:hypothetical protein QAD02_017666 [Eretmocerus hayati]
MSVCYKVPSVISHYPFNMRFILFILASTVSLARTSMVEHQIEPKITVEQSVMKFADNFYKVIQPQESRKNLICSPLSIHMAVSMVASGADGNTAQQMIRSLEVPDMSNLTLQGFEKTVTDLKNVENVTITVANNIFVAAGWDFKTEFKQVISDIFKSEVSSIDINNPDEAAESVNEWVQENTNSKIKEILDSSAIDMDTRMILVNAIYFKGDWATPFVKQETRNMPFYIDENNKKQVPTMHKEDVLVHGFLDGLKATYVVLPYENSNLKMIIVVPQEINGLDHIEANLESLNIDELITGKNVEPEFISLFLPKFKIESEIDLEETLKKLGMTDMFQNAANFSKISDESLKVRKAVHKAYIEVNEQGTEAAGVTALALGIRSGFSDPPTLRIDRPFYFKIVLGTVPLFTGHVIEPMTNEVTKEPQDEDNIEEAQETTTEENRGFKESQRLPLFPSKVTKEPQDEDNIEEAQETTTEENRGFKESQRLPLFPSKLFPISYQYLWTHSAPGARIYGQEWQSNNVPQQIPIGKVNIQGHVYEVAPANLIYQQPISDIDLARKESFCAFFKPRS